MIPSRAMAQEAMRLALQPPVGDAAVDAARRRILGLRAGTKVVVDLAAVEDLDTVPVARLLTLVAEGRARGVDVRIAGARGSVHALLATVPLDLVEPARVASARPRLERLGAATLDALERTRTMLPFLRETIAGVLVPVGRRGIKWDIALAQMAQAGARATPIVVFIAFLVGVVLALNGALQLRQFGAQIFIANLVAISMTREMGPLMTAIVVAGRSGSAIAAEIGTMVVSEEVDALRTMALSPVRFLVVPRVVALATVLPCLTVLATAAGIFGGWVVGVLALELPSQAYLTQSVKSLFVADLLTGLFKSVAFATLIALVGAWRGLTVQGGPEGVGRATTAAVVTSIILCIVTNAGFTAFFYFVG